MMAVKRGPTKTPNIPNALMPPKMATRLTRGCMSPWPFKTKGRTMWSAMLATIPKISIATAIDSTADFMESTLIDVGADASWPGLAPGHDVFSRNGSLIQSMTAKVQTEPPCGTLSLSLSRATFQ